MDRMKMLKGFIGSAGIAFVGDLLAEVVFPDVVRAIASRCRNR